VLTQEPRGVGDKGLKKDALGFVSSCVIGVASTAPGYSLAASLGFVVAVAGVGLQAPAVLLLAFVPMLLIASAYYYGLTGFACTIYYRRRLTRSVKSFFLIGVGPTLGGLILAAIFIKSCVDLSKPENSESGDSWFGLGPPLVIGLGFLLLGVVLMLLWRFEYPDFFRRRREVAVD
jgi:hypothetical protein